MAPPPGRLRLKASTRDGRDSRDTRDMKSHADIGFSLSLESLESLPSLSLPLFS